MGSERKPIRSAVNSGALQGEPSFGMPLIEICGRMRVLIENHNGILSYGCREILVKVRYGYICVAGENLQISKMSREKLVIRGNILSVSLQGRC